MQLEPRRALPLALRIRAWQGETVFSFASRLERNLKASHRAISCLAYRSATQSKGKYATPRETAEQMKSICEAMCVLPPGVLAPIGPMVKGEVASHLCPDCVGGLAIEHVWNGKRYTCERHGTWIAPGRSPKQPSLYEPHPVEELFSLRLRPEIIAADLQIAALVSAGRVSARLIDEIVRRIDFTHRQENFGVPRPSDLPTVAAILSTITDPNVQGALFDEWTPFADRYSTLSTLLVDASSHVTKALVDQIWLLLRQTSAWVRTTRLGDAPVDSFVPIVMPQPTLDLSRAIYPLEPFSRSMACIAHESASTDETWRNRYIVIEAEAPSTPVGKPLLICNNGHVQRSYRHHARRIPNEEFRCSICTGRRIVLGLNSLGDVLPYFVEEWDQSANGTLTPYMVTPGADRKVSWICKAGHRYRAYITNRTVHGTGCPYCAAKAVLAGYNDLSATHPHLAAMWDPDANTDRKLTDVSAGQATVIHLCCQNGHPFIRSVTNLVRTDGRCPTCTGRTVVPGVNDLATTRPDVAAWWHPTMNGNLTPALVKAGSGLRVWWRCDDGHDFPAYIYYRCEQKKRTCPVDSGRWFVEGVNDLATKEPELVTDWDSTLNGIEPYQALRTSHTWSWTCRNGHTQRATVADRRHAGGCTKCRLEDRVAKPRPARP